MLHLFRDARAALLLAPLTCADSVTSVLLMRDAGRGGGNHEALREEDKNGVELDNDVYAVNLFRWVASLTD